MRASSFSIINCYFGGLKLVLGKKTTLGLLQLSNLALTCSSFSESEVFSSEDTDDNLQLENHNWVSSDDESDDFYVGECSSSKTLKMKEDGVKEEDIYDFSLENHNWVSSEDESDDSSVGECSTSKTLKMKEDGVNGIKSILMNHGCNLDFENGQRIDELKAIRILNDLFDGSSNAAIAFHFFEWSESCSRYRHTIRTVCTMIHILVSGNMNHIAVDLIQYLVTNNYGSEEWHHLVFNVLKETHRDSRVLVTVYSMMVNSYIRENIIHMALLLINQMKILHIYPTIGVCNSLLRALLNSDQFQAALEVLEEMHNRGMVNASIMSLFINHHCAKGSIESACKLLVDMVKYGCKPDVVAYTIVINALCKMGHLRMATAILFKMIYMGVPADSVSVTSVIDGYCKARRLEEAMNVLKISCIRSNVFVYNSFISELCRGGKMIEATRLFHEMSELGIQPDCCSYTTIIQGYCKVDDLVIALMYLGEMLKRGFRPVIVTYTVLVESYCKIGNLEMAKKLFNMVRRDGLKPDVVLYNTLMNGYGKNDHPHKACELLDMMRHADVSPDAATYNIIIDGLARRGFVKEAIDILVELTTGKDFSVDILTFTNLIAGYSKTGSCEEACHVWSRLRKHGIKPDVVAYSALLNSYCKARRMEEAKARFREMLEDGLDPDIILYNTLINGFCNIGNIAEACRLVRRMVEQGIIPDHVTHGALVHAFKKEMVENPAEKADIRIQKILLEYGINVDVSQYIYMERQSFSRDTRTTWDPKMG